MVVGVPSWEPWGFRWGGVGFLSLSLLAGYHQQQQLSLSLSSFPRSPCFSSCKEHSSPSSSFKNVTYSGRRVARGSVSQNRWPLVHRSISPRAGQGHARGARWGPSRVHAACGSRRSAYCVSPSLSAPPLGFIVVRFLRLKGLRLILFKKNISVCSNAEKK